MTNPSTRADGAFASLMAGSLSQYRLDHFRKQVPQGPMVRRMMGFTDKYDTLESLVQTPFD